MHTLLPDNNMMLNAAEDMQLFKTIIALAAALTCSSAQRMRGSNAPSHGHHRLDMERSVMHEDATIYHADNSQRLSLKDYLDTGGTRKLRGQASSSNDDDERDPNAINDSQGGKLRGGLKPPQGYQREEPIDETEPECPGGQVWSSCARPCDATCSMPDPICATVCVSRCTCPRHAPIWDGSRCIAARDCPITSPSTSRLRKQSGSHSGL